MKYSTLSAFTFAATAFAQNFPTDPAFEVQEIKILMNDVQAHLGDYEAWGEGHGMQLPSGMIDFAMKMMTYKDDGYTSLISMVDMPAVDQMVTELPWYSSRLKPQLEALLPATTTSTPAQTSSVAPAQTSSVAPASSSPSTPASSSPSAPASQQTTMSTAPAPVSPTPEFESQTANGAAVAKLSGAAFAVALAGGLLF